MRARTSVNPVVGIASLDIGFGGFSPTALSSGEDASAKIEAVQLREANRRNVIKEKAAVDAAKTSEVRTLTIDDATEIQYVVLDDAEVRIERCETTATILKVPSLIEGMPVKALANESFVKLENLEEIEFPDDIVSIGFYVLRDCYKLRSVTFPASLSSFDSGWLRNCNALEHMRLPGNLEKVTSQIFDNGKLKHLDIGAGTNSVMPGAFSKSALESVSVSEDNPWLVSDEVALYATGEITSPDGKPAAATILIAMAVPKKRYKVMPGCVGIAKKGFSTFEVLEEAELPEGLMWIDAFAYTRTGIRLFKAPSSLLYIGERAFFACKELREVILEEGLLFVGSNAFTDTALSKLHLPASVVEVDHPVAAGTAVTFTGHDATFSIGSNSATQPLFLDEDGVLYRNAEDGLHLSKALNSDLETYSVREGTVAIDPSAFAKNTSIMSVNLPASLIEIGDSAFKSAKSLTSINLPDNIERIGEEAFLDTAIEALRIPASLARIGACALVTEGSHHAQIEPTLSQIEVDPGNPRFRMESGLLIETFDNGIQRVVMCTSGAEDVEVPQGVSAIAPYALNGVRHINKLKLSEKITSVEIRGLGFDCIPEVVTVELAEPEGSRTAYEFAFPNSARAAQQMGLAFGSTNFVSVPAIFDHYDNAIVNRAGFGGSAEGKLDLYEQAKRIITRLKEPAHMTSTNRGLMESTIRSHIIDFCLEIAKHDDRAAITDLLDLGCIDEANIEQVIEAVAAIQDASITNHLLEQKTRRFGSEEVDFSL